MLPFDDYANKRRVRWGLVLFCLAAVSFIIGVVWALNNNDPDDVRPLLLLPVSIFCAVIGADMVGWVGHNRE